jgi:GST-like protein
MIDFYFFSTPNARKVAIFLEEAELAYHLIPVDLEKGEQHNEEFGRISPNGKVPVIVDHAPRQGGMIRVFESGAILLYLAEKSGKFMPQDEAGRFATIEWLMWQMAGLGPTLGQNGHFQLYAQEKIPYAIDRFAAETRRLYAVLDRHLGEGRDFIAGTYSIADMACFPWVMTHKRQSITLDDFPHVARWFATVRARPGVQRGIEAGGGLKRFQPLDAEAHQALFGRGA